MIVFENITQILIFILMCIALFAVFMWVYYSTRENSGFRGVVTYLGHLLIFILGWSLGGLDLALL